VREVCLLPNYGREVLLKVRFFQHFLKPPVFLPKKLPKILFYLVKKSLKNS